ncbi:MAG: hypothetical protein WC869_01230 [Phycisphaerae bacterium]|jgi:hypothetical protein
MSCKVIYIKPNGWLGSDPSRINELHGFTHYLVDRKSVEAVLKLKAKCEEDLEEAEKAEDEKKIIDIKAEIWGIKYTMRQLGIDIP